MHALAGMWNKLWNEVAATRRVSPPAQHLRVDAGQLEALPIAARAYLRFLGVEPGEPVPWSFMLAWRGRFRRGADRPWMRIEAVQYDTRDPVARFFHMKARMSHVLPLLARDTYVDGHGHMRARVAGLFDVADGTGPEYDTGELVTWLNDVLLFAPTMLLGRSTRFRHVDDESFDVAFTDGDRTVAARAWTDRRGAVIDFETGDRSLEDPADPHHALIPARWSTPMEWEEHGGRWLPVRGKAIWHLAGGDLTYADFALDPASVAYDVAPHLASRAA